MQKQQKEKEGKRKEVMFSKKLWLFMMWNYDMPDLCFAQSSEEQMRTTD